MSVEEPLGQTMATVKDPHYMARVSLSLQSFHVENSFTDLVFVCARGVKVHTHKLVICSVSQSIKEILLEIPDTEFVSVFLPDVEAKFLELLIAFLYEGHIRIIPEHYDKFCEVKDLLGIKLSSNNKSSSVPCENAQPVTPTLPPSAQLLSPQSTYSQPTQYYCLPTTPNGQGQVQYVYTSPQNGALLSPMAQSSSAQPMVIGQNGGPVVQGNSQVVQLNNQLVAGNQIVSGSQLVQCSSEMMVQTSQPMIQPGNQPMVINNNQMQVGIQSQVLQSNQPVQQQPRYVMSSTTNSHTVGSHAQATAQSSQPHTTPVQQIRTGNRLQTTPQATNRVTSVPLKAEQILYILQENGLENPTANEIRERLESKLNINLANHQAFIEQVLSTSLIGNKVLSEERETISNPTSSSSLSERTSLKRQSQQKKTSGSLKGNEKKKKRGFPFTHSDDERDEDFQPRMPERKPRSRK